jgi:leucyl-tRNA---protein transferase
MPEKIFEYKDFELEYHMEVKAGTLDDWLAKAWFRAGPYLLTCATLYIDQKPSNAHWLRYNVPAITLSRSSKKIWGKNRHFQYCIQPYKETKALKILYKKYYAYRNISMFSELEYITDDPDRAIFDTFVILVKDQKKIIAAGIFDLGTDSVAAIKNFFDPLYHQYSLGKYLILLLHQYCVEHHIKWIYPGYLVPHYSKFDYKLFLDKKATEMYLYEEQSWINYDEALCT